MTTDRDTYQGRPPVCKHCGKPISAWSVSMDGNHSWAHEHAGWYCIIDGVRPGTKAEPACPGKQDR